MFYLEVSSLFNLAQQLYIRLMPSLLSDDYTHALEDISFLTSHSLEVVLAVVTTDPKFGPHTQRRSSWRVCYFD